MEITHILIDMDEVLCDFIGGAVKTHGTTKKALLAKCKPNEWSIVEPLGLTTKEFWAPIDARGSQFWEDLEPLPWIDELIECVEGFVGDKWHVVSAPSRCDTSYTGKVRWLKSKFGKDFDRFVLTPHKALFAKPGHVLIDDRPKNVTDFTYSGSNGLLFPTQFNFLAAYSHKPITYIKLRLKALVS